MTLSCWSPLTVTYVKAFHWFANEDSLREIHRVLKPDGCLGLIWNIEDCMAFHVFHPSARPDFVREDRSDFSSLDNQTEAAKKTTTWESKLNDLIWSLDDEKYRFRHGQWRQVFDDVQLKSNPITAVSSANPLFSLPIGEDQEKWTVWLTKENIWARFATLSHIAVLKGEELKVSLSLPFQYF